MPFLTPRRIDTPELLDEHDAPRAEMERSLRDLRFFNRYCGGVRVFRKLVALFARGRTDRLVLLDLGTGTSDLLESLPYPRLVPVGLDFKIEHLTYARSARVRRVVGDAKQLPFRDDSVDLVTSSHFFHHFSPEENEEVLADSLRVARRGVAFTDTRRHYFPLLFVRLLGLLRVVGEITRYDAPASVLRGYTTAEARALAARVRGAAAKVSGYLPYRWAIVLRKES
jgi:ubiquinone/menaquinone biosynthesis C-methylase UbiE